MNRHYPLRLTELAGLLVVSFIGTVFLGVIIALLWPKIPVLSYSSLIYGALWHVMLCAATFWRLLRLSENEKKLAFMFFDVTATRKTTFAAFLLFLFFQLISYIYVSSDIGAQDYLLVVASVRETPTWLSVLVIGFMAPAAEEVFFRGVVYDAIYARIKNWFGTALITSTIWSIFHWQYSLSTMLLIIVLGMILGYLRNSCKSVVQPFLFHSLCNLISVGVAYSWLADDILTASPNL